MWNFIFGLQVLKNHDKTCVQKESIKDQQGISQRSGKARNIHTVTYPNQKHQENRRCAQPFDDQMN